MPVRSLLQASAVAEATWEVIVIGGGPAGLSAALTLGRCRRRVLICDAGRYRNRASKHMHCFLTRDGTPPKEFLQTAREQLRPYEGVELRSTTVTAVEKLDDGFDVVLDDGTRARCRKLLLATGVIDELPKLEGIDRFYGVSVHHCPYCDGWEWRDRRIGAYGNGDKGAGLALMLRQWSADVALFTDDGDELTREYRERLARFDVAVHAQRIARLDGDDEGHLQRVVLESGRVIERDALFFNTGQHQRSALAEKLGCEFTERGGVQTHEHEVATCVPGLYVAGDASRDVQLVVVAVAEGTKAGFVINRALLAEDGLSM
jgi:thioredoxin reductase